jgi:hypothetical protein
MTDDGSSKLPALPQHLIGQGETNIRPHDVQADLLLTRGTFHAVHDEGLKNLLMSWYYAGSVPYFTINWVYLLTKLQVLHRAL